MSAEKQLDAIFQALASETRRHLLDVIKASPGCSVNDVCEHFEMSRIGVMKHLKSLTDARLVVSRKEGRTRQLYFNAAPIQLIYDRWTDEYSAFWASQAVDLKYKAEKSGKSRSRNRRRKKGKSSGKSSVTKTSNSKVA